MQTRYNSLVKKQVFKIPNSMHKILFLYVKVKPLFAAYPTL